MSMQDELPPVDAPAGPSANDKTMGTLSHVLGIFLGPVGPLIIWLTQKDTAPWAGDEAKEALNFQITMLIGWAVCFVLTFIVIGAFLMPIVGLVSLIFSIMGAIEANKGLHYKYPFAIRLIK